VVRAANGVVRLRLTAAIDPSTRAPAFEYDGAFVPPTIELSPGDTIDIEYANALPASKAPPNMTNLHFHGMTVSPKAPADDVLTMIAMPGQRLHYRVPVPRNQEPGLYWYHTHAHGESNWQVESGMSGALVVDGVEEHDPAVLAMRQRILVLRDPQNDPNYRTLNSRHGSALGRNDPCAREKGRHVTVNGVTNARIAVRPGERQFFRVVNASAERYFDLHVDGEPIALVAQDGYPVDTYPGEPSVVDVSHVLVPPAGRAEFVVTGSTTDSALRSACVDTGPDGAANPAVTLASLVVDPSAPSGARAGNVRIAARPPGRNAYLSSALPPPAAKRTIVFSEDPKTNRYYINGRRFSLSAPPMFVARTGTVEEWTIENTTFELHAFHIHQTHFLVTSVDGVPVKRHQWLDTVNLPYARQFKRTFRPGNVVVLVNFLNPVIKGEFVFHCHLLEHEDGGMMAKILVR